MNEISIHVPIYLATNKILYRDIKEDISEGRGAWIQERPIVGPNRPQRQS